MAEIVSPSPSWRFTVDTKPIQFEKLAHPRLETLGNLLETFICDLLEAQRDRLGTLPLCSNRLVALSEQLTCRPNDLFGLIATQDLG